MIKTRLFLIILLLASVQMTFAGVFVEKKFFSASLNREETYYVSLPTGYDAADTTKKFPVILFLHGASVNAEYMVSTLETVLSIPFTSTSFQKMRDVIFVIPDGSADPYLGSFYTNSELYGNYEDFIANDLTNDIRSNYNTYDHREKWAIMGHSMGGYGSMKIALKHSDQFIGEASLSGPLNITYYDEILPMLLAEHGGAAPYDFTYEGSVTKLVYSMAGAFSPDTTANPPVKFPINTDGTINQEIVSLWEEHNPINLIRQWKGSPAMAIYMYCGGADEYKLAPMNQQFSDSLTHYEIKHQYTYDAGGDHVNSLLTSFPAGLNFLANVLDTATITNPVSAGMQELASAKVYPNPASDIINLSTEKGNVAEDATILSLSGGVVKQFRNVANSSAFPIQDLNPGCYLIQVTYTNGKISRHRFIKTKN